MKTIWAALLVALSNSVHADYAYTTLCFGADEGGSVSASVQITPGKKTVQGYILRKNMMAPIKVAGTITTNGRCELVDEYANQYLLNAEESIDIFNGHTEFVYKD